MRFVSAARVMLVIVTACAAHMVQGAAAPTEANWYSIATAAGTSPAIVKRLHTEIAKWTEVAIAAGMPRE